MDHPGGRGNSSVLSLELLETPAAAAKFWYTGPSFKDVWETDLTSDSFLEF